MKFSTSTVDDVPQIVEWTQADPYHEHQGTPEWWISGNGSYLSGCIEDESGPVLYFRLDREDPLIRLNVQFAPYERVSKRRLVNVMLEAFPKIRMLSKTAEFKGMIFSSTSPKLIRFLEGFGFKQQGEDFVKYFEEN